MKPFCVSLMMKGKTGISLLAIAAEAILISVFKRLIDFFENYYRHTHSRSHTLSYTRRGKCIVGNISKRK